MRARCYNPNNTKYPRYGGRGITICEEWLNSVEAFYNWALDNDYKVGLQIDRLDNDGNYTPNNCRFVTAKENRRNNSMLKYVSYKGVIMLQKEACAILKVNSAYISNFIRKGHKNKFYPDLIILDNNKQPLDPQPGVAICLIAQSTPNL